MANQIPDAPTKFQDFISKSGNIKRKIHEGPRVRYLLAPNSPDTPSRRTYGQKDPTKANKTILMVGETGTGKSTLINAMVNYVMGVEKDDGVWFEIVEEEEEEEDEEEEGREFQSQTPEVTVYKIFDFGMEGRRVPYSVTLIDTPGFTSTDQDADVAPDARAEQDATVAKKLLDLFRTEEIETLDAVGVVMKESTILLDDMQRYVFCSILDLFGNDMVNNMILLTTHCAGNSGADAFDAFTEVFRSDVELDNSVQCLFNNRQSDIVTEEHRRPLDACWRKSEKGMKKLFTLLETKSPQTLKTTTDVLERRIQLRARFANLNDKIKSIDLQLRGASGKKSFQPVSQNHVESHPEWQKAIASFISDVCSNFAVSCTTCQETCHYPGCNLSPLPRFCSVMKEEEGEWKCTVCTYKCSPGKHVKQNKIYLPSNDRATTPLNDHDRSQLLEDRKRWVEEAYQHVVDLRDIAMNQSFPFNLDLLIENLTLTGDTEKAEVLEKIKRNGRF